MKGNGNEMVRVQHCSCGSIPTGSKTIAKKKMIFCSSSDLLVKLKRTSTYQEADSRPSQKREHIQNSERKTNHRGTIES